MASYLRSWLYTQTENRPAPSNVQPVVSDSSAIDDDDDTETIHGDADDADDKPPAFPSLHSAQRVAASADSAVLRILNDSTLMPPPPVPSLAGRRPGVSSSSNSLTVPSTSNSLTVLSTSNSLAVPLTTKAPSKSSGRGKVILAPGHGPLDWANLKKSGEDLRGVDTLLRVTPSMLKEHRRRDDAWSVFNGKVYNITPYLPYHPGGEKELMRVAGRDGSKLFAETHAWVNLDYMLDACMIGFLVPEHFGDRN